MTTLTLDPVDFCKALADDTRQGILRLLQDGEKSVTDIVAEFHLSQPTISHHLSLLKNNGLVTSRQEGKQIYYALDRENLVECCGLLLAKFEVVQPKEIEVRHKR